MDWKIKWTLEKVEFVIKHACLNEFQAKVLMSRVQCMTIKEMCYFYNCSEKKIRNAIDLIAERYDELQKEHPDILNPRRRSVAEEYMDNN